MGGISFIVYTDTNINIDFTKKFMEIKHRGIDDTNHIVESSIDLNTLNTPQYQQVLLDLSKDEIRNYIQYTFILGFHRMCINDTSYNGMQPIEDPILNKLRAYPDLRERPNRKLICNGEIYNYVDLKKSNDFIDKDLSSICDVEVILPMYIKNGIVDTLNNLDGEFAFVLTENIKTYITSTINVYVARDYLGIKPLYYITNKTNKFYMFVSEIKALPSFIINNETYNISQVPPGSYWSFQTGTFIIYNNISRFKNLESCTIINTDPDTINNIYINIRNLMTQSVISRYGMSFENNISFGILLSGGFDSSILTTILLKYLTNQTFVGELHLFTIGDTLGEIDIDVNIASDLVQFFKSIYPTININHHIVYINDIDILTQDIEKIIYHLETFDPKTIRESIPFYFLFKYIKEFTNVRVLLSGDGIDELCGYSNFNDLEYTEFQSKSVDLLLNLCNYDLLRTDRISCAFNLELRHPFLQKSFVEYMLTLHPKLKKPGVYKNTEDPIEKYIIRKAFDTDEFVYLPKNVLWRTNSCICDSLSNFELRLTNYFNDFISDNIYNTELQKLLNSSNNKLTLPTCKEELYYRILFDKFYPNRSYIVSQFWNNIWKN